MTHASITHWTLSISSFLPRGWIHATRVSISNFLSIPFNNTKHLSNENGQDNFYKKEPVWNYSLTVVHLKINLWLTLWCSPNRLDHFTSFFQCSAGSSSLQISQVPTPEKADRRLVCAMIPLSTADRLQEQYCACANQLGSKDYGCPTILVCRTAHSLKGVLFFEESTLFHKKY